MPPHLKRERLGRNIDVLLEEQREQRRTRWLRISGYTLLFAASAYLTVLWFEQRGRTDYAEDRVVVALFDNRTGDASSDHLGPVTADWVTNGLLRTGSNRRLVPTATVLAYTGSARLARYDPGTRARLLGRGTRAQIVVHGSYYHAGDQLRFRIHIDDLAADTSWTAAREVVTSRDQPYAGVDQVKDLVIRRVLRHLWYGQPPAARMPDDSTYAAFVRGLSAYANGDYVTAVPHFTQAANALVLEAPAYLMESLVASRQYARADSMAGNFNNRTLPVIGSVRFDRSVARLRGDLARVYGRSLQLTEILPADDVAQYDLALAALAINHPREARRIFSELYPNRGALYGRSEFYLHYAAAHHLLGQHRAELSVVRDGQIARPRSIAVRLAYCRARAALGERAEALSALNALSYADSDTAGTGISIPSALEDCGAELDAHGLADLARHARNLARVWRRGEPASSFTPDSVYESGRFLLEHARARAQAGQIEQANASLLKALDSGLPFYEHGRVMLHADPALRRLRDSRAFLQINQPQG